MRTIIASQRLLRGSAPGSEREALNTAWSAFWQRIGWLLLPAPMAVPANALMDATGARALLLTGGNDLGQVSDDPLSARRDEWERELLAHATERCLPVIGVCRGMQFLVTEAGGRIEPIEGHVGTRHPVHRTPSCSTATKFCEGKESRCFDRESVNSFHHFAVTKLAPAMEPLATDIDGHVEAFVDPARRCLGVMWHPERCRPVDRRDLELFQMFLDDPS